MVSDLVALPSRGNLFEMQIPTPFPQPSESKTLMVGPSKQCLTGSPSDANEAKVQKTTSLTQDGQTMWPIFFFFFNGHTCGI